jgi:hypothetical protein
MPKVLRQVEGTDTMADAEAAKATMIANLPQKTGKALPAWIKVVKKSGLEKHGQIVKLLKSEHDVTHGFANLIAHEALSSGEEIDLVATQYAGKKADLRPILNAVLKAIKPFGRDIEIAPKKTSVSLRRKKQFAVVIPATNSRVDVCIQLKGESVTKRLLAAKGGMTTHKVGVTELHEIDKELVAWLREAYNRAG